MVNLYSKAMCVCLILSFVTEGLGSEGVETEPYKRFWTLSSQQELETFVQKALHTANVQQTLSVTLLFNECNFSYKPPLYKLRICKKDDRNAQVGELICLFGERGSVPKVDKMFPEAQEEKQKWALLQYIEINVKDRNQGYSKHALNIFHCFVDILGSDFAFLNCDSSSPHAGHTYKQAGYEFHPTVLNAIKIWGRNNHIEEDQEEAEFLKDTNNCLRSEFYPMYMFRKRKLVD